MPHVFQRLYICLEACKRGFKSACRPLIGLDGCFLKGYYGGELLAAVAQDANNSPFVIAYAFVDAETKANWKWFLELLHEDLGDYMENGWNFISDQQKGLIPALQEVMPGVNHRFCVRHMWVNFYKQWKNPDLNALLWKCAKAKTMTEFNGYMEHMKRKCDKAWAYLNKLSPQSWTRAAFSGYPKNESLLNNACEQLNSAIVLYRSKPIITLAEEVRMCLVRQMNNNRAIAAAYPGTLCPKAQIKLEIAKKESLKWTPFWAGDNDGYKFEVECRPLKVVVDIGASSCSCNSWDISGIPCEHAIACLAYNNLKAEDYVHPYYSKETWRKTYEPYIHPVASQEYWEKRELPPIDPPPFKRPAGRPKKVRRKNTEDPPDPHKLKRKYGTTTCSKCGQSGHNAKGCKGAPVNSGTRSAEQAPLEPQEPQASNIPMPPQQFIPPGPPQQLIPPRSPLQFNPPRPFIPPPRQTLPPRPFIAPSVTRPQMHFPAPSPFLPPAVRASPIRPSMRPPPMRPSMRPELAGASRETIEAASPATREKFQAFIGSQESTTDLQAPTSSNTLD